MGYLSSQETPRRRRPQPRREAAPSPPTQPRQRPARSAPTLSTERTFGERFKDAYVDAASRSMVGRGVRELAYQTGMFQQEGESDADYRARIVQAERKRRSDYAERSRDDSGVGGFAVDLVGSMLGGADPTYLIGGPAGTGAARAAGRIATQGGVNAATSIATQGAEVREGVRDEIDYTEAGLEGLAGVGFQGGLEGIGKVARALRNRGSRSTEEVLQEVRGEAAQPEVEGFDRDVEQAFMEYTRARNVNPVKLFDELERGANPEAQAEIEARVKQLRGEAEAPEIVEATTPSPVPTAVPSRERINRVMQETGLGEAQAINRIRQQQYLESSRGRLDTRRTPELDQYIEERVWDKQVKTAVEDYNRPKLIREVSRDAQGNISLEYRPTPDADPIPIRMGIDDGVAEVSVDPWGKNANKLGPAKMREAITELQRMYPEIKTLGGFRRSGAGAGRVQEITPRRSDGGQMAASEEFDAPRQMEAATPEGPDPNELGPSGEGFARTEDEVDVNAAIDKLRSAIDDAEPMRAGQQKALKEERSRRASEAATVQQQTSGEAGFYAELSKLRGALPTTADFESIRGQFDQAEIDALYDVVKNAPGLTVYEKIAARSGLGKLLGAESGSVPYVSELDLLAKAFPEEIVNNLARLRPMKSRLYEALANLLNTPRALMSSFDLSAPLRQGVFMVGRKEFYKSFAKMFELFGSQRAYNALEEEIASRPTFELMKDAKLAITRLGRDLSEREEAFMSQWAEKIPVVGAGVRASERAFVGFLNRLRADVFDDLVAKAARAGVDFDNNPEALRDIARYINAATGRGDLGKLNQAAPLLSGIFFSPRLMASRVQMLNPAFYATLHPVARKEAIKDLLTFGSVVTTALSLAAAAGADVELDPRSADFGKIKIGNTRYDIMGGFQQYLRLAATLASGQAKTASGRIRELNSGEYGSPTRLDVVARFFTNKESPVASFVTDWLRGKNPIGEEFNLTDAVVSRIVPMVTQDIADAVDEYGPAGLPMSLPAMFGVGAQTYEATPESGLSLTEGRVKEEIDALYPDAPPSLSSTITLGDGDKLKLSEEQYAEYQKQASTMLQGVMEQVIALPEWSSLSDDEKKAVVKDVSKAVREQAKEDFLEANVDGGFSAGIVTSGRRTVEGNRTVRGVPGSSHLSGNALDFVPSEGYSMKELEAEARRFFGPDAKVINEGDHVHVELEGMDAPYYGQRGTQ